MIKEDTFTIVKDAVNSQNAPLLLRERHKIAGNYLCLSL